MIFNTFFEVGRFLIECGTVGVHLTLQAFWASPSLSFMHKPLGIALRCGVSHYFSCLEFPPQRFLLTSLPMAVLGLLVVQPFKAALREVALSVTLSISLGSLSSHLSVDSHHLVSVWRIFSSRLFNILITILGEDSNICVIQDFGF